MPEARSKPFTIGTLLASTHGNDFSSSHILFLGSVWKLKAGFSG